MDDAFVYLAQDVIDTALSMNDQGINHGKSGNVSARYKDGFIITASGLNYEDMTPETMVYVTMDGQWSGQYLPSSEWRMHRDIYANAPNAEAVIHTHATYCTALACLHLEIPAFHYMVAMAGGDTIRCAPYATFGSQALSDGMMEALDNRKACLLANHGMIAYEASLAKALGLAVEVENLAKQYALIRQLGTPIILDTAQMDEVIEKFKSYGVQPEVIEK